MACCLLGGGALLAQHQPGSVHFQQLRIEPESPPLHFEHLVKQGGLPPEGVYNLYADRAGFLWLCSHVKGLFRYDGYTFKAYPPNPLDSTAFPATIFHGSPVYDRAGRLWFATDAGLVRYDAEYDRFHTFSYLENEAVLAATQCVSDTLGYFHVLMGKYPSANLYRFDPGSGLFDLRMKPGKTALAAYGHEKTIPLDSVSFSYLLMKDHGRLWFWSSGRQHPGLMAFAPVTDQWTFYPYPQVDERLASRAFTAFLADEDGEWLWLSGWDTGLQGFNRRTLEWTLYTPSYDFLDIYPKNRDELWLTGYEDGLFVFHKKTGSLSRYMASCEMPDPSTPLPGRVERIIRQPSTGLLFLGGEKGISIIDPHLQNFTAKSPLPDGEVVTMYADTVAGKVWALYTNGHLYEWAEATQQLRSRNISAQKGNLFPIQQDAQGKLWIGAAYWVNPATLEPAPFKRRIANHADSTHLLAIWRALPAPNGDMWFCNRWGGMIHFDVRQDSFTLYNPLGKQAAALTEARNALPAGDHKLWIATAQGLSLFDTITKDAKVFTSVPGDTTSLPHNYISDIAFDRQGRLWICTQKGLCRYEPASGHFQRIKNTAYLFIRMVLDHQGDIWARANEGLYHYRTAADKGRLYTERDGLRADLYERIALSPGGAILLGSVHYFFPEEVKENTRSPEVVFTGFRVFDQDFSLPKPIDRTEEIALRYTDNFFTIEFAALNLTQPWLNQYRWQLQGIDPHWVEGGTQHSASYTYLPPGAYTFQVMAANNDGHWNPSPRSLRIHILPAWWQTGWFRALVAISASLIVWAFYRTHIARIRAKEETRRQAAELSLEKARFQRRITEMEMTALRAQMNPHFLFNVLMSINRFMLENDAKSAAVYLARFSRLIRLVLENSKSEKVTLGKEVEALTLYMEMEALRFKEKVSYHIDIAPEVDMQYIQIPPLLFQPFVENAIWHGLMHKDKGGTVRIRIDQPNENLLHVEIEDDGIGRRQAAELKSKSAARHKSFGMKLTKDRLRIINHLYQMDNRVQVIDLTDASGEPCGTKVILEIPV